MYSNSRLYKSFMCWRNKKKSLFIKKVLTTYSSQFWNIKDESPLRSSVWNELLRRLNSITSSWKRRTSQFTSSSSSCHAADTGIPDPLSPLLPIIHPFWQVFKATFRISGCMYVRAGRSTFAWPYAGVHSSTSLVSSSLFLQQCPACLVPLTCIVFVMGGRWSYSWCLVGCCRQDLFTIARNILE